jgi:hypothetical protein
MRTFSSSLVSLTQSALLVGVVVIIQIFLLMNGVPSVSRSFVILLIVLSFFHHVCRTLARIRLSGLFRKAMASMRKRGNRRRRLRIEQHVDQSIACSGAVLGRTSHLAELINRQQLHRIIFVPDQMSAIEVDECTRTQSAWELW